ncbi:acyl-CoA thioesterase [Deinococcus pimensis]|uniref:acyl-CoA thioesterase n=1 Tax=Deinococcus pimensis TaxID=309888 RepID=UPI0005EBACED|nr:thioesterase family protein [Deinococcus pimensis]
MTLLQQDAGWAASHTTEIQMRFGDVDSLGHVNNVAYAQYLETARLAFLDELTRRGVSLPIVVARLEVDYRREITLRQRVRVQMRCSRVGNSSFDLVYRVLADDDTLAAEARSVQVHVDLATRRPVPLTAEQRVVLAGLP